MNPLHSIRPTGGPPSAPRPLAGTPAGGPRFADVLKARMEDVRWSAHAQDRLKSRGIVLSDRDRSLVEAGVRKVAEKGGRNSLLLLRDIGLVVSVQNRTVVTAVDRADLKERVFTEIDSTVILE
jgi:flagellar operon protein